MTHKQKTRINTAELQAVLTKGNYYLLFEEESIMSELMSITFGDLLEDVARRYPDRLAVKYIDRPYERTWKEFDEEVTVLQKVLKMGIPKAIMLQSGLPITLSGLLLCLRLQKLVLFLLR